MSLTQELKNLAMVDIFTEAKKTDLFIGRPYYLDFDKAYLLIFVVYLLMKLGTT